MKEKNIKFCFHMIYFIKKQYFKTQLINTEHRTQTQETGHRHVLKIFLPSLSILEQFKDHSDVLDIEIKCICYRPQRSCSKVIFSEACVKNSVHSRGVCLSACWDTPPWADTTSGRRLLQWTVRILLECILV